MNKFSIAMKRFGGFMKRNAFYFLIVLCIASVATVIALAVTREKVNVNPDASITEPDKPVIKPDPVDPSPVNPEPVVEKLKFYTPCNNGEVKQNYADTSLVWSPTLKHYSTHLALDFTSEDGNVYASADGTIKEIGYNQLDGNYVVISHKEGYVTRYLSLENPCALKVGASVKHGQLLGKMSTSQGSECMDGAHLHFEVQKDGKNINPLEVLVSSEK